MKGLYKIHNINYQMGRVICLWVLSQSSGKYRVYLQCLIHIAVRVYKKELNSERVFSGCFPPVIQLWIFFSTELRKVTSIQCLLTHISVWVKNQIIFFILVAKMNIFSPVPPQFLAWPSCRKSPTMPWCTSQRDSYRRLVPLMCQSRGSNYTARASKCQ